MTGNDVESVLAGMTLAERVARLFMIPVSGTALTPDDEATLRALKPGGVILVGNNFGSPDDVRALVVAIHATNPALPPLAALDQEGGVVSRIVDDPAPDAATLGRLPREEIANLARQRAQAIATYGFDVNFAPVADVAFSSESFMRGRSFGDDPAMVAGDVAAYLEGVSGTGVLHCVKHFPGHGRVSIDSHESLPTLDIDEAIWWETDALPFREAVATGVPMVMLGHLVAPMWGALPATLSPEVVRVLRDRLGFSGVVVTDDLLMGALSAWDPFDIVNLALAADVDLLLYVGLPTSPEALIDHVVTNVERGRLSAERISASTRRLLTMQLGREA